MTRVRTVQALGKCVAYALIATALGINTAHSELQAAASPVEVASGLAKAPVDQLIPWLLSEDRELRGVPFSEVIFDATGKRVLRFDRNDEVDRTVGNAIGQV